MRYERNAYNKNLILVFINLLLFEFILNVNSRFILNVNSFKSKYFFIISVTKLFFQIAQ